MKELKKDSRKSIQVSKDTHDILVAIKKIQNHLPLGKIVDSIVKEKYKNDDEKQDQYIRDSNGDRMRDGRGFYIYNPLFRLYGCG